MNSRKADRKKSMIKNIGTALLASAKMRASAGLALQSQQSSSFASKIETSSKKPKIQKPKIE